MDIQPKYLPLAALLSNRLFRIPHYQRAYSWQTKQRQDMFDDIRALRQNGADTFHFMATVVGLRRETKTIVTDQYREIEVVDGQQRLTTLVMLLKAIEKKLDTNKPAEEKLETELRELLVKGDNLSLLLLQTNHDRCQYFTNYLRAGQTADPADATTLADRELLRAIHDCESFVEEWPDKIELLRIIKNQLTFIFHELDDEAAVYTIFEVLNNRGLRVSWVDRLKSMLMSVAFEFSKGNKGEHIDELHRIWGQIYEKIGLRQGMSTEALRFAATLRSTTRPSKSLGEADAVEELRLICNQQPRIAIELSQWLLKVSTSVDKFLNAQRAQRAVSKIAQARLLATAIILKGFSDNEEKELLKLWERTSFRVFGLCRKDARTSVGDYIRLAWDILNKGDLNSDQVSAKIRSISEGKEHTVEWAETLLANENCYEGWEEQLRYFLFRYEEHLSREIGQKFNSEQWARIWEDSAARSIEHIMPQSKGSQERTSTRSTTIFVHRLGNLMLLPPGLNSKLLDKDPVKKADEYLQTGLLLTREVANTIKNEGWGARQVEQREKRLLEWLKTEWA